LNPVFDVKVLSDEEIDDIHQASLTTLEKVGVRIPHKRILSMMRDFGCEVDKERELVRFPSSMIEEIAKEREPREKQSVSRFKFYCTGQCTRALDLRTGEVRPATTRDLREAAFLADVLPNIDFCPPVQTAAHPLFIPQDVPESVRDIHAFEIMLTVPSEPQGVELFSVESLDYFLKMSLVANDGSMEKVRKNQLFRYELFCISPLQFSEKQLEIAVKMHDLDLKVEFGTGMPIAGLSAPVTLAGLLVLQDAEFWASMVLDKVLNLGIASYPYGPRVLDMRHGSTVCASPDLALLSIANAQLQRHFGFPNRPPLFFYSNSKLPDIQTGLEKAYMAIFSLLAGWEGVYAAGVLGDGEIGSIVQLVIDDEIATVVNHLLKGIEISSETLSAKAIESVGIGGSFLASEHTRRNFRQLWMPELGVTKTVNAWTKDKENMLENAKKKAEAMLKEYRPRTRLDKEQIKEIRQIVELADREIGTRA